MDTATPVATRTTCPYCGVGCGILATPDGNGGATMAGDPHHPANYGRLCSKGSALGETLALETRLLHPMVRSKTGALKRASWDAALDVVAHGLEKIGDRHGPNALAFYLSGQLLTEDYYVANKLMKGFIGSANVDTNSRLCMASSVAGHRRAFGGDIVPGTYEDLDLADVIVLVGSNAAWCHPVLFQRMAANRRARGAKLVVIDPRRTVTAQEADLFLPIAPGTDSALFCGLLVHLAANEAADSAYVRDHTAGFDAALMRARTIAPDIAATARATGLAEADVAAFFALFKTTERVVTAYSQGVNQSAQGTDKVNAIINCHLLTGRIGRPGMGPFSLTGQPNAMGGREVGGLANQLAAHMTFAPADVERVKRFWTAPNMAAREGHKAVPMFQAIGRGEIKGLWVMATNPVVSLPNADDVRAALRQLDLFVVSDNVLASDTVRAQADVLLPAAAWGEKNGTVTNSERRISRQRAFLPLPGEAKPDWWIVAEVARRLGFADAFAYQSSADIFREHAALSGYENEGTRAFDIGAFDAMSDIDFDALEPVLWPQRKDGETTRFFAEGGFFTPEKKAQFVAVEPPRLRAQPDGLYPLVLNTGRIRDQWHTMTRTGLSPRLGSHLPEPFVEIHPDDAIEHGLRDGGFAAVQTLYGRCVLKVVVTDGQQHGTLFAPIHWSGATASHARVGSLVSPATDPMSGQPEAKATPAMISPVHYRTRGFILARDPLALPADSWWALAAVTCGTGVMFATNSSAAEWHRWASTAAPTSEFVDYLDAEAGVSRIAAFEGERLVFCMFAGPTDSAPLWDVAKELFAKDALEAEERRAVVSGKASSGASAAGALVCACYGVGVNTIRACIDAGAMTTDAIGAHVKAGTNCGSCIPELRKMIGAVAGTAAVAIYHSEAA